MSNIRTRSFPGAVKVIGLLVLTAFAACGERSADDASGTLFRERPAQETGVTFVNQLTPDDAFNIIEYLYYYNGGGVAAGDVNGDGLPDLYFTANQGPNALYLNRGGLRFEDVTEQAGVAGMAGWATGVTMADVNGDGRLDIYVCRVGDYKGIKGHNELFINQGDGTFREAAAEFGLDFRGFSTQAAFFDYDGDGDLDCYLLNHSVHSTENYGTADIRSTRDALAGDRLYRNDGPGTESGVVFKDVTEAAGIRASRIGYGLGVAVGDLNGDGRPDLYISNDFHENDYLYYNLGDGAFREAVTASLGHASTFSMGSDVADVDNDGRLDLMSLDMKPDDAGVLRSSVGADPYNIYRYKLSFGYYYQYPRNMLQWNRGNLFGAEASFSEIGQLAGVDATDWSWAPLFADLDGDGWKDLFISNGIWQRPNDLDYLRYISSQQLQAQATDAELAGQMPSGQVRNYAFRNSGDLSFEDVTVAWGLALTGCTNGAAYADLDGDGDLDLVLNNLNRAASIFENQSAQRAGYRYLRVQLAGAGGNTFGVGARVEIEAGGRRQVQECYPTRGFQSAVEPVLTFGLGQADTVDRLIVRWPTGEVGEWRRLAADQTLTLRQAGALARHASPGPGSAGNLLFQKLPDGAGIDFRHQENEFIDFDSELLAPHMLSTQGPRLAVGDIDGDGRDDLYICGARGQSGALYRQTAAGRFRRTAFITPAELEEVDAALFDADGDGDLDLYIVSGGGEHDGPFAELRDQLWINDGRGGFRPAPSGALPERHQNGACVVPLDYDGDGALDLFVGGRSRAGYYGLTPESYLLHNDGNGSFRDVTATVMPDLAKTGMVSDACRIAGPGVQHLVVVGEWMPVTVFTIRDGAWRRTEIPDSHGWWNVVTAADLDGDGDEDLLLGNLGLNTDLRAARREPVELYIKDFDSNFKTDPILTYFRQGRRYPYASLDELARQLTNLRKQYPDYRSFAADTFGAVFPPDLLAGALHRQAHTFASAVALNRGDGAFDLKDLPRTAQIAPLFGFAVRDFDGDGIADVLAVGNFHDSRPALGRYDASYGHFLRGRGDGAFVEVEPARSGFALTGQGRDVRVLNRPGQAPLVVVARNNAPVVVLLAKEGTPNLDF